MMTEEELQAVADECGEDIETVRSVAEAMACCTEEVEWED